MGSSPVLFVLLTWVRKHGQCEMPVLTFVVVITHRLCGLLRQKMKGMV